MENILAKLDDSMNLHLLNYKAYSLLKEFLSTLTEVINFNIEVNSTDKTAHGYIVILNDKTISDAELVEIYGENRYIRYDDTITIYLDYTEEELLSHNDAVSSICSAFDYAVNCLDGLEPYSDAAYEIENTIKLFEK